MHDGSKTRFLPKQSAFRRFAFFSGISFPPVFPKSSTRTSAFCILCCDRIIDNRRKTMTKFQIFSSEAPYPEPEIYSFSRRDVLALTNDYAGRESETTAIMQYAYQSYIVKEKYPDLSLVLENVSKVEMLHHELLAEAIVQSGGDPVIAGRNCFWSGSAVNYTRDVCALLKADLEGELGAIANYRRTISALTNKSLVALIERIIEDEEIHVAIFRQLLSEFSCAQSRPECRCF